MAAIQWNGLDYYENVIYGQRQYVAAVKLANGFLYSTGNPINDRDIQEFIEADPDGNEAWLLYRDERPLVPTVPFANVAGSVQSGKVLAHQRYSRAKTAVAQYEALLLLRSHIVAGCLYIDVDAFCRDPWSDTALCTYWADRRLRAASEALGGANELRISATESDTPLQRELKKLGYFCFSIDRENREYQFSKILTPRNRKKASTPPSPPKGKGRRKKGL